MEMGKEKKNVSFAEEVSIIGGSDAVENAKAGKPRKNFSEEP